MPREDTQFKPGNPGGPGRPKGRTISEELRAILGETSLDGKPRKDGKPINRQIAEELAKKALGRKSKAVLAAIDMFMDRTEGKVPVAIQQSAVDVDQAMQEMALADERCDSDPDDGGPASEVQGRPEPV